MPDYAEEAKQWLMSVPVLGIYVRWHYRHETLMKTLGTIGGLIGIASFIYIICQGQNEGEANDKMPMTQ